MTWLYVPYASSTDTAASNSDSDPWHGYEPWLVLSGTPTQRPYSWRGWKKRDWIRRLSGMMSAPSMVDHGVAEWIWSPPAFPASRSPQPGRRRGLTMIVGSGRRSVGYSTRYDPATSSWRTSVDSFATDYPKSSQTLPVSGSMRNGVCYPQPPLVPLTSVNESGLWGTPVARDDQKSPKAHLAMKARMGGNRTAVTSLTVQAKLWPTPRASMNENRTTKHAPSHGVTHGKTLAGEAGHQAQTIMPAGQTISPRADLNPSFVAALMGLPLDWLTPYTSAETASSLKPLLQPGCSSLPVSI